MEPHFEIRLAGRIGPGPKPTSGVVFNVKFGALVQLPLQGQLLKSTASPVPLPAALPLFGTALAGLAGVGWFRRGKVSQPTGDSVAR
jgi:hypothetical protein